MKKHKIVALSDNHCDYSFKMPDISDDVVSILIHTGDATFTDKPTELQDFIEWMKSQTQFDYKLWIAGNHSLVIEDFPYNAEVIDNETGSTYIHDKVIEIEGLKFFGSNFTPEFNNWAFNLTEKQSRIYWENAPEADVIICHGPPHMILDKITPDNPDERPLGCIHFRNYLERVKPKVAIFGHIHGGFGHETITWDDESKTECYNVSVMNEQYQLTNPATVIEIYGLKMKKNKWTWEEVYQLGRNSSDAGVKMECERIAVKIVKDIPLIENDIRYLNRILNKTND